MDTHTHTLACMHSCMHAQVFRLTYPYQEGLRGWGDASPAAAASLYSMPAALFYNLHPFHMLMDSRLKLLQWGPALARLVPGLCVGDHLRQHFKV